MTGWERIRPQLWQTAKPCPPAWLTTANLPSEVDSAVSLPLAKSHSVLARGLDSPEKKVRVV